MVGTTEHFGINKLAKSNANMDDKPQAEHQPSLADVLVVKAMLSQGLKLPVELVDVILDHGEYWVHSSSSLSSVESGSGQSIVVGVRRANENRFILRSLPVGFIKLPSEEPRFNTIENLPIDRLRREQPLEWFQRMSRVEQLQKPARKVVFTIKSKDQGWGGDHNDHGTYNGSWTWFDAGIERFDADAECMYHLLLPTQAGSRGRLTH
jgi:hypothetical protein